MSTKEGTSPKDCDNPPTAEETLQLLRDASVALHSAFDKIKRSALFGKHAERPDWWRQNQKQDWGSMSGLVGDFGDVTSGLRQVEQISDELEAWVSAGKPRT